MAREGDKPFSGREASDGRAAGTSPADQAARDRKVDEIFQAVQEVDPEQQMELLASLSEGDAHLEHEVLELLAAARTDDSPLNEGPAQRRLLGRFLESAASVDRGGERLGPYRLVREIGRGGMGVVFEAARDDGLYDQKVAVKVLAGGYSATRLARFTQERQILARLEHPAIARLLDGGVTEDGHPYLVMERVEGRPIDRYCTEEALGLDARLGLFVEVCAAVEAAHHRLVVHRDLKPSNILVDDDGQVKLLDFGIAKWIDVTEGAAQDDLTRTQARVLTPAFASPEQMTGDEVTVATDVYQLGLLLHLLICGRLPYDHASLSLSESARVVLGRLPKPPSQASDALSDEEKRQSLLPAPHKLRGDLDAITLLALRAEPTQRYPSCAALREDIESFLEGRPVVARRPSLTYRSAKFVSRNLGLIAGVAAALLLVVALSTTFVWRLVAERDAARLARDEAEEVSSLLLQVFRSADPIRLDAPPDSSAGFLDRGLAAVEDQLERRPLLRSRIDHVVGVAYQGIGEYGRALELFDRALETREELLPVGHPDIGRTLLQRSGLLENPEARLEQAERAMGILEAGLGQLHADTARAYLAWGNILAVAHRYDQAEEALGKAFTAFSHVYGPRDAALVPALLTLGEALTNAGRIERAEPALLEALSIAEEKIPGHVLHGRVLSALAVVDRHRSRWREGEERHREALEVLSRTYGDDSPELARSWSRLGFLAQKAGRLDVAEQALRRAVELEELRQPPVDLAALPYRENLASLLTERGRIAEANALLLEILADTERVFGESSANVAWSYYELGKNRRAAGETDSAVRHFQRADEIFEQALGAEDRWRSWPLHQLGELHLEAGRPVAALPLLRRAYELRSEHLDPSRAEIAESRDALAAAVDASQR